MKHIIAFILLLAPALLNAGVIMKKSGDRIEDVSIKSVSDSEIIYIDSENVEVSIPKNEVEGILHDNGKYEEVRNSSNVVSYESNEEPNNFQLANSSNKKRNSNQSNNLNSTVETSQATNANQLGDDRVQYVERQPVTHGQYGGAVNNNVSVKFGTARSIIIFSNSKFAQTFGMGGMTTVSPEIVGEWKKAEKLAGKLGEYSRLWDEAKRIYEQEVSNGALYYDAFANAYNNTFMVFYTQVSGAVSNAQYNNNQQTYSQPNNSLNNNSTANPADNW